jgi:rieske iron-sulfur protein
MDRNREAGGDFAAAAQKVAARARSCRCASDSTGVPRRIFLRGMLAGGLAASAAQPGIADDTKPGDDERPQPGDVFVFFEGERQGKIVALADMKRSAAPALVWPMDPKSKVVRSGSRLNQVVLLALDPASLDSNTRSAAPDGVIAYSAICTHAGCTVTGWVKDQGTQVLKCPCHNSEYDPRRGATVVFGPAPRHLAMLPVSIDNGALVVAKSFIGKVGPSTSA